MSVFTVDTRNVTRIAAGFDRASAHWQSELMVAGQQSGTVVTRAVQAEAPVRTGELRAKTGPAIVTRIGAVGIRINVPLRAKHAKWVVDGRRGFEARPGKVLRITLPSGDVIYRKRVGPSRPNNFPARGFAKARGQVLRLHQDALRRVIHQVTG